MQRKDRNEDDDDIWGPRAKASTKGGAKADARSRNTDLLLKSYKKHLDRKRSRKTRTADAS